MINTSAGTPFMGYVSLTNGSPGPTAFALFVNGVSYTLQATERLYVTNLVISSNDTATALITVDDGATTPRKIANIYSSVTIPATVMYFPNGIVRTGANILPRAGTTAVTSTKTVECVIQGYISKT